MAVTRVSSIANAEFETSKESERIEVNERKAAAGVAGTVFSESMSSVRGADLAGQCGHKNTRDQGSGLRFRTESQRRRRVARLAAGHSNQFSRQENPALQVFMTTCQ